MKTYEDHTDLQEVKSIKTEIAIGKKESIYKEYEFRETRELVLLVKDAADLIRLKGETAFSDFNQIESRWRNKETYIFVLDPAGNMLVHPDSVMAGKNQLHLQDINGKYIIKGLLAAATAIPDKPEGWYHYQWPEPGGLLPRWKSSYVELVEAPSGKKYIVGSGMYNDRMEKAFVVDAVRHAVREVEQNVKAAFEIFHDPKGPYIAKDAYIFVIDMNGVELVNPAFPNIEGRKLLELKDTNGKQFYKEMIRMIQTKGEGWLDYMWPKPGESVSTQKSAFVCSARFGEQELMVGCGVYLSDAPKDIRPLSKLTATELMTLVREAASVLELQGDKAYTDFRNKGSRWFRDDTYLFVFSMDGKRAFHAAEPESEGRNDSGLKDILGRPIVKMIMDVGSTSFGEGWVHYMYPEPGDIFPAWKSSFVKRVTFPNGVPYIVGCGIYKMQMDKSFTEDVVNRASALVAQRGHESFDLLRDKTGPFVFMDTYVFVLSPDGTELVNAGQPSLEGKNIIDLKDLNGKPVIKEEINAALTEGSAWLEFYWYLPGDNTAALKQTYVRKVQHNGETFIVGSGLYGSKEPSSGIMMNDLLKINWQTLESEKLNDKLSRQKIFGSKGNMGRFLAQAGAIVTRHFHENEEFTWVISGSIKFNFDNREIIVNEGEVLIVPPSVPHSVVALKDTEFVAFFAPLREDWLRGEDQYLRK
jgi:signal transduction histidine kinase/quercetin dioxygenase-like cupin family protein